jgi:hypothetical protein
MDVDATLVDPETGPDGQPPPSQIAKKEVSRERRSEKMADGVAKGTPAAKKISRWALPALGTTLVLAFGIVWVMRTPPAKETGPGTTGYQSPPDLGQQEEQSASSGWLEAAKTEIETTSPPARPKKPGAKATFNSVVESLMTLAQDREATFLQLSVAKPEFEIGEPISYHFRSDTDCYLVLVNITAGGELIQVFPNGFHLDQHIEANRDYAIPDEGIDFQLQVTGPAGTEEILAFAADVPFDLFPASAEDQLFVQAEKGDHELLERISERIEKMEEVNIAKRRITYTITH